MSSEERNSSDEANANEGFDGLHQIDATQDDYYQILNIERTATNEEITNAYRQLSRIYHPDKHSQKDRDAIADAEHLFSKTKRAYEVLTDPQKRAIYDTVGVKGLELELPENSSALIPRYRTAQEIREEYERQVREREERFIERKTNPKGNMTVNINATEIFNRYEDEYLNPPILELTAFHFTQSVDTPLTNTDTLILHGGVSAHNGRGSGSIHTGIKKNLGQHTWGALEVGGGSDGMELDVRAGTQIGKYYWGTFQGIAGGEGRNMFMLQLSNQITTSSVGSLTWRVGSNLSGLQCSYVRDVSPNRFVASLHLGIPHSFGLLSYARRVESRGEKYKGAVKAGTFGAFVEYGVEKKISELSVLTATMTVGLPMGVNLKLKVQRSNQTYIFPIQLAEEILPAPIFYGTITPFILFAITKKLFLDPYQEQKKQKEKDKLKQQYKERLKEKRAEAQAAINLMQETYVRVEAEEKANKGLIISEAFYGCISVERELSNDIIDVTVPLQCLVKQSKLVLPSGCKSQLPGFYDPAPGEEKKLLIRYTYDEIAHESLSRNTDAVKLPKLSHRTDH